jgi:hypothetical protein
LTVAARGEVPFALHPLKGALIVRSGFAVGVVEGTAIKRPRDLMRGLPLDEKGYVEITDLTGAWPDATFMSAATVELRAILHGVVLRWDRSRWVEIKRTKDLSWIWRALTPWGDRQVGLGVYQPPPKFADENTKNLVEPPPPKLEITQGYAAPEPKLEPGLCPSAAAGLRTGELFVVGTRCPGGQPFAARWTPGAVRPLVEELPRGCSMMETIVARGPSEVHAAGGCLARFDGAKWSEVALPTRDRVRSVSASGGALYVVLGMAGRTSLWKQWKQKGGVWEKIDLPEPPLEVVATGEDDFWVATATSVLRTGPAADPLPFPGSKEAADEADDVSMVPATRRCKTPFVLVSTEPYDLADVRAALQGQNVKAVWIESITGQYGARLADFDSAEKLVKLLSGKLAGRTPELLCRYATPRRTITLE